ncbi:hypothetical protein ACIPXT_34645, partial [Streptomyces parvus]
MATAHNLGHSVIRHRLEPSPAVEIKLGIVPMLDEPAHKVLEDDLNVHAAPWERLLAVENLADSLPQRAFEICRSLQAVEREEGKWVTGLGLALSGG